MKVFETFAHVEVLSTEPLPKTHCPEKARAPRFCLPASLTRELRFTLPLKTPQRKVHVYKYSSLANASHVRISVGSSLSGHGRGGSGLILLTTAKFMCGVELESFLVGYITNRMPFARGDAEGLYVLTYIDACHSFRLDLRKR